VKFIKELRKNSKADKSAGIIHRKISAYIDLLCEHGTRIGEPVVKHLSGDIWELRPLNVRLLFAFYKDDIYLLLHHFSKSTKKTPIREIDQAKRNFADYIKRKGNLEEK
jgi:phage-related protein